MRFLEVQYPQRLKERFKLEEFPDDIVAFFDQIGKQRGYLLGKGEIDYDKVTEIIIREIRTEKMGPLSFERPEKTSNEIIANKSKIK